MPCWSQYEPLTLGQQLRDMRWTTDGQTRGTGLGSSTMSTTLSTGRGAIRLFFVDLTGDQPPRVPLWPMEGRQSECAAVYERGLAKPFTREELKAELDSFQLYPVVGAFVAGEAPSETAIVETIVGELG